MSLLNVNSSLGNNQLSNVCNAQDIITKMRCITFITPANSQLHRFSYFSAFKSFFFFFFNNRVLPMFYIAATVHSMPGAAHLTSKNSAQCKTFSSPCSFICCCSTAERLWDSANSDRFCCYILQKNA